MEQRADDVKKCVKGKVFFLPHNSAIDPPNLIIVNEKAESNFQCNAWLGGKCQDCRENLKNFLKRGAAKDCSPPLN